MECFAFWPAAVWCAAPHYYPPASRRRPSTAKCARSQDVITKLRWPISLTASSKEIPDVDSSTAAFRGPIRHPFAGVYFILGTFVAEWNYDHNCVLIHFQMRVKLALCLQHAVKMLRFCSTCCIFHERHARAHLNKGFVESGAKQKK